MLKGSWGGPNPSTAWDRLPPLPGNLHFSGVSNPTFMFQPLEVEGPKFHPLVRPAPSVLPAGAHFGVF